MKILRKPASVAAPTSVIAVDTGLTALGWARWDAVTIGGDMQAPDSAGVIESPPSRRADPWVTRASAMMLEFVTGPWTGSMGGGAGTPRVQVIEWAEYRGGDAVGIAAAAEESLTKLAYMAGMHARMGDSFGARTILAPVSEWKGQLPKHVVAYRIAAAIGTVDGRGEAFSEHAWDAVGIGLWFLGHRLDDGRKFGGGRS